MPDLLDDRLNLLILREVCFGKGLDVNVNYLSHHLKRHRNTVRERVRMLFSHNIIDRPIFPFIGLFKEYPLLVVSYADLPDDKRIIKWVKDDKNIFAAFRVREGESNMMLFEFHKDVWDYQIWRDALVAEGKIPERGVRIPSSNFYFSNRLIVKYEPSAAIHLIENEFQKRGEIEINGYVLDELAVKVLKHLLYGEGIRVNENLLAEKLGVHRRTISQRISKLQEYGYILKPLCRFPSFFTPPNFLLVFSLMEIRRMRDQLLHDLINDPHISLAYRISEGRYNLLLFECHLSIEDYLTWESIYSEKYPGCFGSVKINYLSPKMTISIDQQKVSLKILDDRLKRLKSKTT